jgi:hypothetical protein
MEAKITNRFEAKLVVILILSAALPAQQTGQLAD